MRTEHFKIYNIHCAYNKIVNQCVYDSSIHDCMRELCPIIKKQKEYRKELNEKLDEIDRNSRNS